MATKAKAKAKPKKAAKAETAEKFTGRVKATIEGIPITRVARFLGAHGFEMEHVDRVIDSYGFTGVVARRSLSHQLSRGKNEPEIAPKPSRDIHQKLVDIANGGAKVKGKGKTKAKAKAPAKKAKAKAKAKTNSKA